MPWRQWIWLPLAFSLGFPSPLKNGGNTHRFHEKLGLNCSLSKIYRTCAHCLDFNGLFIQAMALSYYSDLALSQEFQPMAAQLSMKAALPLSKILATASCRSSNTGPISHQPITCHASYPIGTPTTSRAGLCSSLILPVNPLRLLQM